MKTAESLDSCYQAEKEIMEQHIQKTIDDVTRIIREKGDKLLGELKDEYDRRKVNLNAQLKELECVESDMSYAREYAEKLVHYGNAAQLMSAKKGISSQMEELLRMETKLDQTETDYMEFKPSDDFCQAKSLVCCVTTLQNSVHWLMFLSMPGLMRIDITLETGTRHKRCKMRVLKVDAVLTKPDESQENIVAADNGDSTWSLKTVATVVGTHEITVSVSKKPITRSPVTVRVIPQKGLICKFGRNGTGDGEFKDAFGVMVTRDGTIRVCDRGSRRLQTLTLNGQYQSTTTFSNIETTVSPDWSTVSEDGTIFTNDGIGGQVIVHDENGRVLRRFGKGVISYCFGIAISPLDSRVYVVGHDGHSIHIFDQDGNHCKSFGCEGQGQGQLRKPVGIAIDG
ncbi:tripartite motif-containing protein 2-like [Ptychodera flava]|uniref:tripartite motif-containing protein 2-like n=1 Tax=Ptychodera flava TaxID=63121 RepID=UPI00396AA66B